MVSELLVAAGTGAVEHLHKHARWSYSSTKEWVIREDLLIVVGMARYYFCVGKNVEGAAIFNFLRRTRNWAGETQCLIVPKLSRLQAQGEVRWLRRESSGVFDDRGVVSLARRYREGRSLMKARKPVVV